MDSERTPADWKISYTVQEAAVAVGVSVDVIRRAIRCGDLSPRFPTSRPVLMRAEVEDWVDSKTQRPSSPMRPRGPAT